MKLDNPPSWHSQMPLLKKVHLLIVDDNVAARSQLVKLVQFEPDIDVVGEAGDGLEALALARKLNPHIVLMDINMPVMDGIKATEMITAELPNTQVVMMSVQGAQDYVRRSMLAGAREFLTKPFTTDELMQAIRTVFYFGNPSGRAYRLKFEETALHIAQVLDCLEVYASDPNKGYLVDELSRMAVGIAHDLRSPLNIILSLLDQVDIQAMAVLENQWKRIKRRTQYCLWIADNFLKVSMNEKPNFGTVKLIDVVQESINILEGQMPTSLEIAIDGPEDTVVYTDRNLLRIVLMNIISNAFEALPDGGTLSIQTQQTGSHVKIIISDSGPGIKQSDKHKLFTVGFSTKPAHCGVGLHVARRIMRQQYGDVMYCESDSNSGSKFVIVIAVDFRQEFYQKDISDLETILENSVRQLELYRDKYNLSGSKIDNTVDEIRGLISVFSYNLHNELSLIEVTIRDLSTNIKDDKVIAILQKIAQNCSYARLLIRNMMEIGEASPPRWEAVSLPSVIDEVLELLEKKIPPDLYSIEWEIDPTLDMIEADSTQLKQVFVNLVRNALDAMPDGGVIKFCLVRKLDQALISVSDSGVGIMPDNLNNLFILGFTTKRKGYGIGLYSVRTIVTKHNGQITVFSKPGKGTTFTIKLPMAQKDKI